MEKSSPAVDDVLLGILPKALDRDTFHISKDKLGDEHVSKVDFVVNHNLSGTSSIKGSHTSPQERIVCILDRTGDLELAAKTITSTRTSSNCTSPYCPDLVLVNEYVKDTFIERCLEFADKSDLSSSVKAGTSEDLEFKTLRQQVEKNGDIVIHKRKTSFTIIELKNRCELNAIVREEFGSR